MATKTSYNVKDFTEPVKELSKLVKETYLNTLDFSLSVAEENKKVFGKQLDYVIDAEVEYMNTVKGLYGKFPKEEASFAKVDTKAFDEGWGKVIEFQKSLVDSIKGASKDSIRGINHDRKPVWLADLDRLTTRWGKKLAA